MEAIRGTFLWRDPELDGERLMRRAAEALAAHAPVADAREARLLGETWTPAADPDGEERLALHFMERFAPITEGVAKGLAYTAITTMRLERPLGQQEEFNRAAILFARWAAGEIRALRAAQRPERPDPRPQGRP